MGPEEWQWQTIEDCTSKCRSGYWGSDKADEGLVECLVIRNGDVSSGGIAHGLPRRYVKQRDLNRARVNPGDVILTTSGYCGTVAYVDQDLADKTVIASNFVRLLRPNGVIDGRFLYYSLSSDSIQRQLDSWVGGTAIKNLKTAAFRSVELAVPPLPEQQKIAAILSSVDDVITATRTVIEQTKRVKQGLLQTLMTRGIGHTRFKVTEIGEIPEAWEVVPFASLVTSRNLGTTERGEHVESNYQLIKMGNLTWGGVDLSSVEAVRKTAVMRELELRPGDFLFNTRNTPELVGKTAVWQGPAGEAIPDNNIMRVRFDDRVLPDFVCGQMAHGRGKARLRRLAAGSTSVAAIYWKDLARYPVALPPVDEQEEMMQALRGIDSQIARCEAVVGSASRTKRGLMQDLLTGRVRVQPD